MEKKRIIFRADGNAKTGLGHLYRIFALIEMFKTDFKYQLVVKDSSVLNVIPKDYNLKVISGEIDVYEEPQWLSENYNVKNSIIIADGYQFDSVYQKNIKDAGFKLVYVDDLAEEHMYADVVINHSPHIKEFNFISEKYTQFALGTKYAILRPLFIEAAKKTRHISRIDTAFVCFGGADYNDLTLRAVTALMEIPVFNKINVVLGAAYCNTAIIKLVEYHPDKIFIHRNLSESELMDVMLNSNFAVVPASTILYELCCIKMPILCGYFVPNQKGIYTGFAAMKAIYPGGNYMKFEKKDFLCKIEETLRIIDIDTELKIQQELFDENISTRYLDLISELC